MLFVKEIEFTILSAFAVPGIAVPCRHTFDPGLKGLSFRPLCSSLCRVELQCCEQISASSDAGQSLKIVACSCSKAMSFCSTCT